MTGMWVMYVKGDDRAVSSPREVRWKVDGDIEPTNEDSVLPSVGYPNLAE